MFSHDLKDLKEGQPRLFAIIELKSDRDGKVFTKRISLNELNFQKVSTFGELKASEAG